MLVRRLRLEHEVVSQFVLVAALPCAISDLGRRYGPCVPPASRTQLDNIAYPSIQNMACRHVPLRRPGRAATFAGQELEKQGEVALGQGGDFEPIHVSLPHDPSPVTFYA
jgi:hypothetical protein